MEAHPWSRRGSPLSRGAHPGVEGRQYWCHRGSSWSNGGSSWSNGGSSWSNGGSSWSNEGSSWSNGGSSWSNLGSSWSNGGSSWSNGGSPVAMEVHHRDVKAQLSFQHNLANYTDSSPFYVISCPVSIWSCRFSFQIIINCPREERGTRGLIGPVLPAPDIRAGGGGGVNQFRSFDWFCRWYSSHQPDIGR